MPLMTKIRENLATFFSIFAGLFVVYIVLDWGMDITGRKRNRNLAASQEIGRINNHPILAKDFAELLRRALENQKAQSGVEPDEEQQRMIRDQIWQQLVEQSLYDEQIEKLGIKITDQEIIDWVRGDNPPEFLRQRFIDSNGTFNRQAYDAAIMDPSNRAVMVQVEDILRRQRQREKLQSIITASVQVSENEVLQKFLDQNIKYDADFAFFDPNILVKDEEINVTDDDYKRYYNENSDDFKVEATRKLKYVLFKEIPSKADSQDVLMEIEDILKRTKEGANFDTLAKIYSELPNEDTYQPHGSFNSERENAIFSAKKGDIIGPLLETDGYHLIKVIDFRPGKEDFIHASHILIKIENNDSVKALKEAKSLYERIKNGENFGELAQKYSKDPGSSSKNGDLGWFGKGRMVKPFEDAVYKARPGQLIGPIRTNFGYHIIKVHAKDNREVKITDIHMPVRVSSRTRSEISQRAQDFAYLAKEGSFEKEAEQSRYTISETPSFQKDGVIGGIGMNNAVNKFAFKNKVGTVSDAIPVSNGYGVFMVSEVKEAGIRPFEEVKSTIEARVKREKKNEKLALLAEEIRKELKPSDSLQLITTKNPKVSIQHLTAFTAGGYIPGVGRDLNFIGALSALKTGEISQPIKGTRGVYLIKLLNKSPFDSTAFAAQKQTLRNQILSEKKNRFFNEWSNQLKKSAEIVDNRDLFYR